MVFNSFEFLLLFFPVVTILFFCLPQDWRWLLLLSASCAFYMAFVPAYILILVFTIVIDYFAGLLIERSTGARRRLSLVASLVANIGVLAVFKYYGFILQNFNTLLEALNVHGTGPVLRILLPIGLSFHTFQAMSYTIEVYRGNQRAERHFGIYALYVMFYPQLVAGPIERPQNLLWQFRARHTFDYNRVAGGLKQIAWGLFKKSVIADQLAGVVDAVYTHPSQFHGLSIWIATVFFAFQIYCDFSGYSEIALGSARVMGFTLMKNFDTPYFSTSISEFWRRWHISLSTWFRDYLYFPLGGNRVSALRWCFNIVVVFLISGLWHGANWTFVIWGALHGLYLIVGRFTEPWRTAARDRLGISRDALPLRIAALLTTFCLVTLAWVFFRAASAAQAIEILQRAFVGIPSDLRALLAGQFSFNIDGLPILGYTGIAVPIGCCAILLLLVLESLDRRENLFDRIARWPWPARGAVYLTLAYAPLLFGQLSSEKQFIYFQF